MAKLVAAFIGGAFIALIALLAAMPPTPDDMERAAGELIPAGAEVEEFGSAGGHPVIVGWDTWASGAFTVDRAWSEVRAEIEATAQELGWRVGDVLPYKAGAGVAIELWRPLMVGRITVGESTRRTAPPDTTYGRISINRNESVRTPLFWLLVAAAGLGAAMLTRRKGLRRTRHST